MDSPLRDRLLLLTLGGSRLYGLHTATSDTDYKGVAFPPLDNLFGVDAAWEQDLNPPDAFALLRDGDFGAERAAEGVVYEVRKFVRLCAECNPNILETLWAPDDAIRALSPAGEKLVASRDLFLTRRARFTFKGYADSQLKRIQTHRRWLLQPPAAKPTRADFGLGTMPSAHFNAVNDLLQKELDHWELHDLDLDQPRQEALRAKVAERFAWIVESLGLGEEFQRAAKSAAASFDPFDEEVARGAMMKRIGLDDNVAAMVAAEHRYRKALREHNQREHWAKTRNAARAALEAKFGYDTKHAMHLVRLLRMGREILVEARVNVRRDDRDELLAIRDGAWTYDELMDWTRQADADFAEALAACPLPRDPDMAKVAALCRELMEEHARAAIAR